MHHLEDKVGTFREARRVLAAGGRTMLVDYGPLRGPYARMAAGVTRLTDDVDENVAGLVPERMREAGFEDAGGERPTNAWASSRKVVRRERRSLRV